MLPASLRSGRFSSCVRSIRGHPFVGRCGKETTETRGFSATHGRSALGKNALAYHDERVLAETNVAPTIEPDRRRRIRPQDLALALGYAGITWLLHALAMNNDALWGFQRFAAWWPLLLAVGCAAVALRGPGVLTSSVIMALAGIALLLVGSTGGFFLIFECIFTLVLLGGARVSKLTEHGTLVLTALLTIGMYFVTGSAAITVTLAMVSAMVLIMPAQWAGNVRHARELASSEARTAAAVAEAAAARAEAQSAEYERLLVAERTTLAREVHDVLSARLSAIALQSGASLNVPQNSALASRAMQEIRTQSVNGIEELNSMIRMLHRGDPLEPAGSLRDIPALIQLFSNSGLHVSYVNALPASGATLDALTQATIYRSINETLINFSKHAPEGELSISLALHQGAVQLSASNPTTPQATTQETAAAAGGTGTGLLSMRARTTEMGGSFRVSTELDTFTVCMLLPLHTSFPNAANPGEASIPSPPQSPEHVNKGKN